MRRRKEIRQVFELIRASDIVLEVVDARLPIHGRVSSIENQIKKLNIPLIIVLNKCDLVPKHICEQTKRIFSRQHPTVYISAQNRQGTKKLRNAILKNSPKREIMISLVGIPNTGKSSLLNILRGKHVAATGQKPGITRHKQVVRISQRIKVFDTPGVIPFDHPNINMQAFLGAVPIGKLEDPITAAYFFLDRIKKHHSEGLVQKYDIPSLDISNEAILAHIAKRRGIILKGAKLNINEAAKVFMREFTAGKFPYWETSTVNDI
ncbi:MAG: GTPase [Candidatus Hodarchaeota archaeon]